MQKKIFPQEIKGRGDQEGKKGMQSRKERKEGNHRGKPRKEAKEGNQGKEITFVPRDDGDHLAEVVVEDARQLLRAHAALARQQRRQRGEARNIGKDHGHLSVGKTPKQYERCQN